MEVAFWGSLKAKTQPVAGLVISTLAEAAFKEGSYCIVNEKSESSETSTETNQENNTISASPSQEVGNDMELKDYEQLRPLGRLATVDELSGVFRFLIGGYFSPCCIRKNTDPPHQSPENMIVLGYDIEIGGYAGLVVGRKPNNQAIGLLFPALPGGQHNFRLERAGFIYVSTAD